GVTYSDLTSLDLYCQSVGSVINVQSTPACPVTVSGSGGDDQCNVTESSENLENLGGPFTFDGGADADAITLYDTHNTFDDAWTMNIDTITRPLVDPIRCVAEDIRAIMGGGNNTFTLTDFAQPYLAVVGFDGNDGMIVNGVAAGSIVDFAGGSGTNAIAVERTSAGSVVYFLGEGSGDSMSLAYGSGDLSSVAGTVNYQGMTGSNDSITLWDDLNDAARNYTFELETFTRTGGFGQLNFYNISNVILQATQGANGVLVTTTASGTALELNGNNSEDAVVFTEPTGSLASLASTVNFIGGQGTDHLFFFDYFRPNSSTYSFTDTQLSGAGFPTQTFSEVEHANLYAGDGTNTINVSNSTLINQEVFGGDGIDTINVTQTALPVIISGGSGLDVFNIGPNPNLESSLTAQAIAQSSGVDQLASLFVAAGCALTIADNQTLASSFENVAGTLSFGHRSTYIALASSEPLFLSTALNYVSAGYANGAWNGTNASFSSQYSASTTVGDGIGYARASDIGVSTFNGIGVFANDVIFTQTLYGDANLSYTVSFNDLLKLSQNYNTNNNYWFEGDFDYNQIVNFTDLLKVSQNYGASTIFGTRRIGSMADSILKTLDA
ncbi:MAG TPA: hypothetical protein PK402_02500, partial [Tepidisphaeraceae bacterium]|nr:hypothetical protein [Tepidisphaeraceae bacterium]